jgi:hypothetical protein
MLCNMDCAGILYKHSSPPSHEAVDYAAAAQAFKVRLMGQESFGSTCMTACSHITVDRSGAQGHPFGWH